MSRQVEARVGTIIGGKWRVDSLLGSGSMAAVYGCTHRNGAHAALKILHPNLCTDPALCERFLGEGYLTNSVKHSGIVRVLDDGVTDDGCVFLVMDLLEGRTLETLRQEAGGKIELSAMLDIADKLMDVLHTVHSSGIIHRDLKPQNVFICDDGSVKLLDFGVARVFDQGNKRGLSMFGMVLGTPSFMSPEQALGTREKVDHRTDIWSLGATIFTGLTGETVHLGPNVQARLLAAATVKARSIAMVRPDIPPAISNVIDTALRFKQEDRWQSVEGFRRAMRDARMAVGLGKPQSVPPPPPANELALVSDVTDDAVLEPSFDQHAPAPASVRAIARAQAQKAQRPAPKRSKNRTLIGIGGLDAAGGQEAVDDEPMPESSPEIGKQFGIYPVAKPPGVAAVLPAAIIRSPITVKNGGSSSSDDDSQLDPDESYPAASNTLLRDEVDPEHLGVPRNGPGVWIAAALVIAAIIGGVSFFAMRSPNNDEAQQSVTSAQPSITSATLPTPAAPVASAATTAIEAKNETKKDASLLVKAPALEVSAAPATPAAPIATPTPAARTNHAPQPPVVFGRSWRAPQQSPNRSSSSTSPNEPSPTSPTPPPVSQPEIPAPAPTPTPDPFGTPE